MIDLPGTLGVAAIVLSLLFAGVQARHVATQTRLHGRISAASVKQATVSELRCVHQNLVERPHLYPFFYEGRELDQAVDDSTVQVQVQIVADMFTDALDTALLSCKRIRDQSAYDDWRNYALQMIATSPTIARLVKEHPEWFSDLHAAVTDARSVG